jgi:hypothetical protein
MRGVTDPNETAAAQQIKQRWSGTRLRKRQKEVQRVANEVFNLKAEVIADVFQFSTILEMASADAEMIAKYVPAGQDPQAFLKQVEAMLRNDSMRSWQIKVAPDSTLEPDEQAEQESRAKVLGAVGTMIQQGAPLAQQGPDGAKLVGALMQFGLRPFKDADQLEEPLRQATEAMANQIAQRQANPPPNPELEKLKLEATKVQNQAKADEAENALRLKTLEQQAVENERAYRLKLIEYRIRSRELDVQDDEAALESLEAAAMAAAPLEGEGVDANAIGAPAPQTNARAQTRDGLVQAMLAAAEGIQQAAAAMNASAAALAAPSIIVRDQTGRAVGVQRVTSDLAEAA